MKDQLGKLDDCVAFLKAQTDLQPPIGIVLGTGLGQLADKIEAATTIAYQDVPYFPVSTVESHEGRLILGTLGGKILMAMQGRFHYYEGYEPKEITFPIRVMAAMGVNTLLISNAAGGLDPQYEAGDLMLISDHINLTGQNPLRGANVTQWGPRFPDMTEPYRRELIQVQRRRRGIWISKSIREFMWALLDRVWKPLQKPASLGLWEQMQSECPLFLR